MSHCELLPIPPVETATDPVHSAADLRQRWRALMGPLGFGERLLRFAFVGPDRCLVKFLAARPARLVAESTRYGQLSMSALHDLAGRFMDAGTTVALLLTRPGRGGSSQGSTASGPTFLTELAGEFGVSLEPIFRANDEALVQVEAPNGGGGLGATMCYMERIGLRELRQHASRYIARVARGETVEVTQRGRLVARIVPAGPDTWEDLILRGDIIPAESPGGSWMTSCRSIVDFDASAALLQLREDERLMQLYFDTSALVKLVVVEPESARVTQLSLGRLPDR